MELNICFQFKSQPRVTFDKVTIFDLKFIANGTEGDITFKVKISNTNLPIFILDNNDVEVKKVEKKMRIGKENQEYSIPLRFILKKKLDTPTYVRLTLHGTNDSGITEGEQVTNIICF